jgi:hypothetical protein
MLRFWKLVTSIQGVRLEEIQEMLYALLRRDFAVLEWEYIAPRNLSSSYAGERSITSSD